jgi:putative ribosome biogenesis GTPase RsgA
MKPPRRTGNSRHKRESVRRVIIIVSAIFPDLVSSSLISSLLSWFENKADPPPTLEKKHLKKKKFFLRPKAT